MQLTIWGNLGADPDLRTTSGGTRVLNIRVACTAWDRDAGGKTTTWVRVAMFGARVEKLATLLAKGSTVICYGNLRMRQYQDQSYLELTAQNIELIGPRKERATGDDDIPF